MVQTVLLIIVAVGTLLMLDHGLEGIAWVLLAGHAYITTHLYYLATRCFPCRLIDLGRALAPGLILNGILILALVTVHSLLPANFSLTHPGAYLGASILAGGIAYGSAFLFLPLSSLAAEAERWRKMLRLAA
jgi:hypothetical protein